MDANEIKRDLLTPVKILRSEIREMLKQDTASTKEILRGLCHEHQRMQRLRIGFASSSRTKPKSLILQYFMGQMQLLEESLEKAIEEIATTSKIPSLEWVISQHGVSPLRGSYVWSYLDIDKAKYPSSFWRMAGYDPTLTTKAYNKTLKAALYLISDAWVKLSNNPNCYYGHVYRVAKQRYTQKNEAGEYADLARELLKSRKVKSARLRETYESGKLPAIHIEMRARRYAIKRFLAHLWVVMYEEKHGVGTAPKPWVIEYGGHDSYVPPPNWPPESALPDGGSGDQVAGGAGEGSGDIIRDEEAHLAESA